MMAAPASAAARELAVISCGDTGNASDMVGVWTDPVTAQLMITLLMGA
jgi:hypothetical protein